MRRKGDWLHSWLLRALLRDCLGITNQRASIAAGISMPLHACCSEQQLRHLHGVERRACVQGRGAGEHKGRQAVSARLP